MVKFYNVCIISLMSEYKCDFWDEIISLVLSLLSCSLCHRNTILYFVLSFEVYITYNHH